MKNKKGFIFVETLIVIAILTVALLMTYSTYSGLIMREKTRIKYNDTIYIYRTYYIADMFKSYRLDRVVDRLKQVEEQYRLNNDNEETLGVVGFGCTSDIFVSEKDESGANQKLCDDMIGKLHISRLYLTHSNLSGLQNCTTAKGVCAALLQVSENTASYLKTVGGSGNTGYRIIVEYKGKKDGSECTNDFSKDCNYYYATINVGEINVKK